MTLTCDTNALPALSDGTGVCALAGTSWTVDGDSTSRAVRSVDQRLSSISPILAIGCDVCVAIR